MGVRKVSRFKEKVKVKRKIFLMKKVGETLIKEKFESRFGKGKNT